MSWLRLAPFALVQTLALPESAVDRVGVLRGTRRDAPDLPRCDGTAALIRRHEIAGPGGPSRRHREDQRRAGDQTQIHDTATGAPPRPH